MSSFILSFKQKTKDYLYIKYLLFFGLVYFAIFYNLDNLFIMIWDEARVACSSFEMAENGNYFVINYNGDVDTLSTKPVLLNWLQAISIKLFSFSELAVRLPSAIAGLITCISLLLFYKKRLQTLSFGFILTLILITSTGYTYFEHSVRTADYEGILSMFLITGCLQFFIYINEKKDKSIFLAMLLFTGATMVKGPAGLFFAPSLLIYLLIERQLLRTLKNKYFYLGLLAFVVLVGGVFAMREFYHPGYLKLFNEYEFLGRQSKSLDNHTGTFWFYLDGLVSLRFDNWILFSSLGLILGLFATKDTFIKKQSLFFLILFVGYFLIISTAQTKCPWYDYPLLPILSYFAAIPIWFLYQFISSNNTFAQSLKFSKVFGYLFLLIFFFKPYLKAYNNAVDPGFEPSVKRYFAIQDYLKYKRPIIENSIIAIDTYFSPQLFYKYKHADYHLKCENYIRNYNVGDKVLASESSVIEFIEKNYNVDVLDRYQHVTLYKIKSKK